jgi:hypothetical protein
MGGAGGAGGAGGMGGTGGTGGAGGGGGGQRTFGSGPTNFFGGNTTNIAGDTSFSKDIETNQKQPKQRTYATAAPKQSQIIGKPGVAMQQLANMNQTPFIRRA